MVLTMVFRLIRELSVITECIDSLQESVAKIFKRLDTIDKQLLPPISPEQVDYYRQLDDKIARIPKMGEDMITLVSLRERLYALEEWRDEQESSDELTPIEAAQRLDKVYSRMKARQKENADE